MFSSDVRRGGEGRGGGGTITTCNQLTWFGL